jgi:2-methylcitrate dehydratase PrpD
MAQAGVTGVMDMLEGERGFGHAMSDGVDWHAPLETLGTEWTIIDTTPKAHACCGHNFATLDAILLLSQQHEFAVEEIERIEVETYRAAVEICGNPVPQTPPEGRFSLAYCAAVMVHEGQVTPDAFTQTAMTNSAYRALASRIELKIDPEAEARFPHARSATVTLRLSDGRRLRHFRPTRKGDPDDPITDGGLQTKYHALVDPILGAVTATALADAVWSIESRQDVSTLPLHGS